MTISAKVIAHSASKECPDIYTLELEYPRFIHQEFMTHRVFSRNASSSRAMSIEKNLQEIQRNPAMPIHWGKNEKGMQAKEELEPYVIAGCINHWQAALTQAVNYAGSLSRIGLHKQIVNRVVEPFSHIRVIVTATEWDNFFALRLHPDAQPEIQELARVMKVAMDESKPCYLHPGEWHMPYVDDDELGQYDEITCRKISVARCARVSYKPSTNYSIDKDIELFTRLKDAGHFSPFEHVATPMQASRRDYSRYSSVNYPGNPESWERGITHADREGMLWSGNFREWIQYRQILEGM